ncbi:DnaJ C-terminal domain-containing protein [Pararhodospirillum photometricum]|uniref:DnaJ C-terminal domain-containing protein n=1 Tax=Pararhodospirillum photometricum TaxID=1084 RepID=UPI0005A0BFBE|nr:DnaJ C-terminal domain-containing protein [Pararhodospirillum photometricum]
MAAPDPYATLGVARTASQDEIHRAYRALAKEHHPDLNPGNALAEERFKNVSVAHDVLSDPERRGRFDRGEINATGLEQPTSAFYRDFAETDPERRYSRRRPSATQGPSQSWDPGDLNDLLNSLFDDPASRPGGARARRGRDVSSFLDVGFLDALRGASQRVEVPGGRVLDIKIAPGTPDGQTLRLRGQGGAGSHGGAPGDALITIRVGSHPFFRRSGQDLRLDLPISLPEAVLGGAVTVPTPGGPVSVRLAPYSESGTTLRLRQRGVPAWGGDAAGDLLATLRVVIGPADAALETFLRAWTPEPPLTPRQAMETPHD